MKLHENHRARQRGPFCQDVTIPKIIIFGSDFKQERKSPGIAAPMRVSEAFEAYGPLVFQRFSVVLPVRANLPYFDENPEKTRLYFRF